LEKAVQEGKGINWEQLHVWPWCWNTSLWHGQVCTSKFVLAYELKISVGDIHITNTYPYPIQS